MLAYFYMVLTSFLRSLRSPFSAIIYILSSLLHRDPYTLYERALLLPDDDPDKIRRLRYLNDTFLAQWGHLNNLTDVSKAISALENAMRLASDVHEPAIMSNLGAAFARRFIICKDVSDIKEGISICKDALQRTPEDHQDRILLLINLGNSLALHYTHFGDIMDLEKAIEAYVEAVRLAPDDHQHRAGALMNVGISFGMRFQQFGDVADLDKTIEAHLQASKLFPDGHQGRIGVLDSLGVSFRMRFERYGDVTDLEKAIEVHMEAAKLVPSHHPERARILHGLGNSLGTRFQRFRDLADLDKTIETNVEAAKLTPDGHPAKATVLNSLGTTFAMRFQQFGDVADLDKSIELHAEATKLLPDDHQERPGVLHNLGISFGVRFQRLGDVADLDKSIELHVEATKLLPDDHQKRPHVLHTLGTSFGNRFQRFGDVADLDKAIEANSEALKLTPDSHPGKASALNTLGIGFRLRFQRFGDVADLNNSIKVHREASKLSSDNHLERAQVLNKLGASLITRFDHFGDVADLEEAIEAIEESTKDIPDEHSDKAVFLSALGSSLTRRFRLFGAAADIQKATLTYEHAIKITPDDSHHRAFLLFDFGMMLGHRFERFEVVADIDKAIEALEKASQQVADDSPFKADCLSSLCLSYVLRFEVLDDVADIDKAITVNYQAAQLIPSDYPMGNLVVQSQCCRAHANRYKHRRDVTDIKKAILAGERALQLIPPNDPQEPTHLTNLGNSYLYRFEYLDDIEDINKAILFFKGAACCTTGSALERFRAAVKWADCAYKVHGSASSLEAYTCALDLLPRVARIGLPMAERHRELAGIGSTVRDAAAAAIASEEYGKAVEWLEQGRSIVWGQLLHLRTPFDELRDKKPDLATRLRRVAALLELANTDDIVTESSHQKPAQRPLELAREWDELVNGVREIEGFEDFLLPKKMPQLRAAARSGPVVVINVHSLRCDALILRHDQDDVTHIHLDRFSLKQAQDLQSRLDKLLSNSGCHERGTILVNCQPSSDESFINILSSLWTCVVNPVVKSLAFPVSKSPEPPRIWWCATGPLVFLPLHAAGLYETNEPGFKLEDFFASSYTPTLTALLGAAQPTTLHHFQLLAVAQPYTPGQHPLPNTKQELIRIQKRADEAGLTVISLEGVDATMESVVQHIKECSWLHLACHGTQNTGHPLKSALLLHNGERLELSEIIKMPLSNAEFAFMSACQTATGAKDLSEEAVHLAAGMLLAGYRGIIATMWSIKDEDAPLVADEVYACLFADKQPNHTKAVYALHQAIRQLRQQNMSFASWVPFIHIGM